MQDDRQHGTAGDGGREGLGDHDLHRPTAQPVHGRGPTKARTYITDDLVTVVLQDTLTPAERTLVAHDRGKLVHDTRTSFQEMMADELVREVQEIMQRRVIAFLSAQHIDPDIAIESFVLAPEHGEPSI